LNNSSAHSDGERLSSVRCTQLFHNVFDVHLDGQFADEELFGNVTVPLTAGNLPENLDLALAENFVAVMIRQMHSNLRRDLLLTRMHLTDDFQEFLRRHALEHVSSRSSFESSLNLDVGHKGCQHHDAGVGKFRADCDHCIDATHVGKPKIHECDVGRVFPKPLNGFSGIGCLCCQAHVRLINPGVPLELHGTQYPGGKIFSPAAFSAVPAGQQGNFGRNVLRGFGASQADFGLQRQFPVAEKVRLRFRAEFFNIFNHPDFGSPNNNLTSPLFGRSTQTLANSLGSGGANDGFNPLYQIGGPRSIQFALKLQF